MWWRDADGDGGSRYGTLPGGRRTPEKRRLNDDLAVVNALFLGRFDGVLAVPTPRAESPTRGLKDLDPGLAERILQRGLESGAGPVRAGVVRFAAGLGRWEVIEDRAAHDKDAIVRKVSAQVLADERRILFSGL